MFKIYKIIIIIIFTINTSSVFAHVQHYNKLNKIEFDILRNNKLIGKHTFTFTKANDEISIASEINFEIKKLGVSLYKYNVKGIETYKNGDLTKFISKTNANGKEKFVNLILENNKYLIDGSSYKGTAPTDYLLGTWWNHSIIKAKAQISAVSGRIIKQKVNFIGKENIIIGNKVYKTLHFNFSSSDPSLSDAKKLNTDIWYEEETLNWVKASFKKKGNWVYKLVTIE